MASTNAPTASRFDVQTFLQSVGAARRILDFPSRAVVYAQGAPAASVLYLQKGGVKISVVSATGKEAVMAILGEGDFFGEGCLAGQAVRTATATAIAVTRVVEITRDEMLRMLRQPPLSDFFVAYLLAKKTRTEEDLIDQLFNSTEKRLARALLLLARYGGAGRPETVISKISQEVLAEMIGTTRARVNLFMNKFRRLGYIDYGSINDDELKVHNSLLTVVLHD
jgi:CRP/FNR family transcriptional regulator, cyclic AMP receptor protein